MNDHHTTTSSTEHHHEKDAVYLQELQNEIKEFEKEKERIRKIMGELGGKKYASRNLIINIVFIALAVGLLISQFIFHLFTSITSVEIAIFLVTIKIIWMIHAQDKQNHFMFWILSTIEYRMNDMYKLIKELKHTSVKEPKKS